MCWAGSRLASSSTATFRQLLCPVDSSSCQTGRECIPVQLFDLVHPAANSRLVWPTARSNHCPVPVIFTVCGLVLALSLITSVDVRVPIAFGEKVTLIVQWAAAASELPQVLVWA
jgi:hypothetical protein